MPADAAVLIIGNEILSGRTQDANLAYIAATLGGLGIRLGEARVVPDIEAEIIAAVDALRARYTYVFTTGGIGPTHDDITSASIAKAFGVPLVRDAGIVQMMEAHYPPGGLTEARLRMAEIPAGATLIANAVSKIPGFQIGNVFVLAGVPEIMRAMLDAAAPRLAGGPPLRSRAIDCGLAEGVIAADLAAVQARFPTVDIGSYPFHRHGRHGTSLVARAADPERLEQAAQAIRELVLRHGGTPVEEPTP